MYRDEILKEIKALKPAYLPAWNIPEDQPKAPNSDAGWAIAKTFANMMASLETQRAELPNKFFIAYLDALNFKQNPPLSAKVPVSFTLKKRAGKGVVLSKGLKVETASKVMFETTEAIMVSKAKLTAVVDQHFDESRLYIQKYSESELLEEEMTFFSKTHQEHYLYFGDDALFNIHKRPKSDVGLHITVPNIAGAEWQYYARATKEKEAQWYTFGQEGTLLQKFKHYHTVKKEINGVESYWIRAKVNDLPLPAELTVNFESYSNVDGLYHNDKPLYLAQPFLPFGKVPQVNDIFYIASAEAFSKIGFKVEIQLQEDDKIILIDEDLSWEYWNGDSWKALEGSVFNVPSDMAEVKVNGELNFWVRVRLLDNKKYVQYYCPDGKTFLAPQISAPKLKHINIRVEKRTKPVLPQTILEYKREQFHDLKEERTEEELPHVGSELYFGFDSAFEAGLISLYVQVGDVINSQKGSLDWYYSNDKGQWSGLNVKEGTNAFSQNGYIQFLVPQKQEKQEKFGQVCYWVKALFSEAPEKPFTLDAVIMNAVEASESKTVTKMLLGSSDGSGSQTFTLRNKELFDMELWVLESMLPEGSEGYEDSLKAGYWVRWDEVEDFEFASSSDRIYTVNSTLGEVRFGDDRAGMIPPMGQDNMLVSYRTGGGKRGNVSALEIDKVLDSIAFIDKVCNPIHATGGADMQSVTSVMEMAPKRLKHRDRASTHEDYNYLVREASSDVARVAIEASRGTVKIYLVPYGEQTEPQPSKGLLRRVEEYLKVRMPATVKLEVHPVSYASVSLTLEIRLTSRVYATEMKSIINQKLENFLHPLYGGVSAEGWAFAVLPQLSELYALLGDIEGIAFIEFLEVTLPDGGDYSINDQSVPLLSENTLISNGTHKINFIEEGGD